MTRSPSTHALASSVHMLLLLLRMVLLVTLVLASDSVNRVWAATNTTATGSTCAHSMSLSWVVQWCCSAHMGCQGAAVAVAQPHMHLVQLQLVGPQWLLPTTQQQELFNNVRTRVHELRCVCSRPVTGLSSPRVHTLKAAPSLVWAGNKTGLAAAALCLCGSSASSAEPAPLVLPLQRQTTPLSQGCVVPVAPTLNSRTQVFGRCLPVLLLGQGESSTWILHPAIL